jgi:hypothetical protein
MGYRHAAAHLYQLKAGCINDDLPLLKMNAAVVLY